MEPYQSLLFFVLLAVLLIPAAILGLRGKSLRGYGLAVTLLLLFTAFDTWRARLLLLLFWSLQTGLCFGYLKLRKKSEKDRLFWPALVLALLPLFLVKLGALVPSLHVLGFLGVSYMTFRGVQTVIEIHDGHITALSLLDFSYFLLFFPSVASGPIDRYRRFVSDLHEKRSPEAYEEQLRVGMWKLMTGVLYNFVFASLIMQFWLSRLPDHGFFAGWSYLYGYTLYMFFNFAGYSRMAIGSAYVLGVRLPENFNRPFLACDMKDFWARWHMSLSTWLRDYVYTRFCMTALRGKWFRSQRTSSYLGYFITMTLMGIWHGFALHFLIYGLYHGILMACNEVLDTRWKHFRKLKRQPAAKVFLTLITIHLFGFGLLIFSGRLF